MNQARALSDLKKEIRRRNYSYRTEKSYIQWIKRFLIYLKKNKENRNTISEKSITAYLNYLATERKVAGSTQNQALCAIIFFVKNILHKQIPKLTNLKRARESDHLPVVLTPVEVKRILQLVQGVKRLVVQLLYGSGLRISEALRLRIQDLDFEYRQVFVRNSKGLKDRITILPDRLVNALKEHVRKVKNLHDKDLTRGWGGVILPKALDKKYPSANKELKWQYLFPSRRRRKDPRSGKYQRYHISASSVQKEVRKAVQQTNIQKHATCHTFRHSFATHLLANGYDIRTVQELLGHKNVKTTMVYTHVLNKGANGVKSPIDSLD